MSLVRLVAVCFFLCCCDSRRAADAVDDALAKFLDDKFPSTEQAISALAATGAANAPAILDALGDNRLLIDPVAHIIVYQTTGGDLINAKTGEKLAGVDADSFKKVRVNNALRSAIEAAVGALTLASPDPQKRAAPPRPCSSRATPKALAALDAQLRRGNDPRVAEVMRQARAAIVVLDPKRRPPIGSPRSTTLKARGDQDAQSLIDEVAAKHDDPAVKAAAQSALRRRSRRVSPAGIWLQNLMYGVSAASVLLLAAIGLAITFGVMGVINMAHGEMVMLGAYTTFVVQSALPPSFLQWSLADRAAARVSRLGRCRRADRAPGHPLPLWPAARDAARHLGRLADPAAGGAHAVRRQQPPGHRPQFMSGLVRLGGLQITTGRLWIIALADPRLRRAAVRAARDLVRPAHARGHAEPPHGVGDGHFDRPHRHARLRARLRRRRHRRASRCRRSTTSRPTSARATSSTASWSWCSAASAICGARCSARWCSARQQAAGADDRRRARQDPAAGVHHPVHPEAAARPVRAQGPGGGG